MPNWCANRITIWNDDPKVIKRIIDAFEREALFDEFIPCPKELWASNGTEFPAYKQRMIEKHGAEDWYDWCIEHWGTKWDVKLNDDFNSLKVVSPTKIKLSIYTAWAPPLPVLDHWVDIGCHVRGRFHEPDLKYKGAYKDKWRIQNDPWGNISSNELAEIFKKHGSAASVEELDFRREYLTNWHLEPAPWLSTSTP